MNTHCHLEREGIFHFSGDVFETMGGNSKPDGEQVDDCMCSMNENSSLKKKKSRRLQRARRE